MKTSTWLLGAISIASVLVACVSWRKLHTDRERFSDLSAQLMEANKRIEFLESRPAPIASSAEDEVATKVAAPDATTVSAFRNLWQPGAEVHRLSRAAYAQLRLQMPQSFPDLQTELILTPDQMGRLFDLLVKQQEEYGNTAENLRGLSEAERMRTFAEVKQRQNAELSAMLGAKYFQFEDYKKTQPERVQVASLRRSLESSGEPLRDDKVQALNSIVIAERQRLKQEEQHERGQAQSPEVSRNNISDLRAESDRRILSAASAYLTELQQQALRLQLESRTGFQNGSDDMGTRPPTGFTQ